MKKIYLIISFTILIFNISAEENLLLSELFDTASQNNTSWIDLGNSREKVELNSDLYRQDFLPDFTFGTSPLYTLGSLNDSIYHNFALTAGMSWLLPSDGTLGVNINDSFRFTESSGNWYITQSPSLSLSYSQPIWFYGKFMDFSLYSKSKRLSLEIPISNDEREYLEKSNSVVKNTISSAISLNATYRSLQLLIIEFNLAKKDLEVMELSREQGAVSGTDFWEKQIETREIENRLWDAQFNFDQMLNDFISDYGFNPNSTIEDLLLETLYISLPTEDELNSRVLEFSPALANSQAALETSELNNALFRKKYASALTASFSLTPQYSSSRTPSTNFGDSFSDLFTSDSFVDTTFSISLSLSTQTIAKQKAEEQIVELEYTTALLNHEDTKEDILRAFNTLLERYEMVEEKIRRLEDGVEYDTTLLEREYTLVEMGYSTPMLLERAEVNLARRQNELTAAKEELYLLNLDILAEAGFDLLALLDSK